MSARRPNLMRTLCRAMFQTKLSRTIDSELSVWPPHQLRKMWEDSLFQQDDFQRSKCLWKMSDRRPKHFARFTTPLLGFSPQPRLIWSARRPNSTRPLYRSNYSSSGGSVSGTSSCVARCNSLRIKSEENPARSKEL